MRMTNPRLSPPDAARRRFMLVQTAILIAFVFQAAMKELPLRKGLDVG